ncbi:MAG: DUF3810 family protein [Acidobacteria bacterium]|nr:DUF3810 family protein [Acidobacteriota bacterium]
MIRLLVIGLAVAAGLAPVSPTLVERWFSTGLYPAIQRHLTPISNALSFAVLDLLMVVGCVAVFAVVVRVGFLARRTPRIWPIVRLLGNLAFLAAVVYLAFLVLWGFNYRRVPMDARLLVEQGAPSSQAVTDLGIEAGAQLNALYDEAHQLGWAEDPSDDEGLRAAFVSVQRTLSDAPPAEAGRLKGSLLGPYFRWASIDGMINPLGLEVLANPDLLPFERPFVAAHEWSHLAGYADESEASFVGWLTCMHAGVPARYSAWLFLYAQVANEVDAAGRDRLASALGAGPHGDLQAVAERVQRGQWPVVRDAGWQVYDQYLKANRVEEGVRSYGAVVTLILRTRFEPDWAPVRRVAD